MFENVHRTSCSPQDPFYSKMGDFFGLTFKELLAAKHPTAWLEFERGEISEDAFYEKFFADGRPCDGHGLKAHMVRAHGIRLN